MPNAVDFHSSIASEWSSGYKKKSFSHRLKTFSLLLGNTRGQRWLDAGCGTGNIGALCEGETTFIDASSSMIALCKQSFPDSRCVAAPVQDMPFPNCYFDGVICSSVIEYLRDPDSALREIHRLLKPMPKLPPGENCYEKEGKLIISVPVALSPIRIGLKFAHAFTGRPAWLKHSVTAFSKKDFVKLLERNSFHTRTIHFTGVSIRDHFWTLMVAEAYKWVL